MAYDFVLQPVVLRIYAAGKHEHSLRQLHRGSVCVCSVVLPAGQHGVLVDNAAAILPEFAQQRVINNFQLLRLVLRLQKFKHDLFPWSPWRRKGVQPEGTHAGVVGVRVFCDPLCGLSAHGFLWYEAPAVWTGP